MQAAAAAKKLKEDQEKEYTSWYKRADLTETTGVMRLVRALITAFLILDHRFLLRNFGARSFVRARRDKGKYEYQTACMM